jgi:hypothetical protein
VQSILVQILLGQIARHYDGLAIAAVELIIEVIPVACAVAIWTNFLAVAVDAMAPADA